MVNECRVVIPYASIGVVFTKQGTVNYECSGHERTDGQWVTHETLIYPAMRASEKEYGPARV